MVVNFSVCIAEQKNDIYLEGSAIKKKKKEDW